MLDYERFMLIQRFNIYRHKCRDQIYVYSSKVSLCKKSNERKICFASPINGNCGWPFRWWYVISQSWKCSGTHLHYIIKHLPAAARGPGKLWVTEAFIFYAFSFTYCGRDLGGTGVRDWGGDGEETRFLGFEEFVLLYLFFFATNFC